MDIKLFLEGQTRWEADSPHCLMMVHEMFQHTPDQGQKEAEWTVCWGCWHKLPKLDPEVDISTVQLVWPKLVRKRSSPCTMRCINYGDCWGLHSGSQNWWRMWCLPLKTAKDGNEGKHQKQQWSPGQWTSDIQGAEPLGGGGGKPLYEFGVVSLTFLPNLKKIWRI